MAAVLPGTTSCMVLNTWFCATQAIRNETGTCSHKAEYGKLHGVSPAQLYVVMRLRGVDADGCSSGAVP